MRICEYDSILVLIDKHMVKILVLVLTYLQDLVRKVDNTHGMYPCIPNRTNLDVQQLSHFQPS